MVLPSLGSRAWPVAEGALGGEGWQGCGDGCCEVTRRMGRVLVCSLGVPVSAVPPDEGRGEQRCLRVEPALPVGSWAATGSWFLTGMTEQERNTRSLSGAGPENRT